MLSLDTTTGDNPPSETNAIADPERLTLHNLLIVYPVIIAIVKNLSFRQLVALAQTDKLCFAFLRGGDWDADVRRWNNIRSKCSEVCEFSDNHDYSDPIKEIKACKDCKYGVCDDQFNILGSAVAFCVRAVLGNALQRIRGIRARRNFLIVGAVRTLGSVGLVGKSSTLHVGTVLPTYA